MRIYKLMQELKKMKKEYGNIDVGYYTQYGTFYIVNSVEYVSHRDALDRQPKEGIILSWKRDKNAD